MVEMTGALRDAAADETTGDASMHYAIAIHGGAGTITRGSMTPKRESEYRNKLSEALLAARQILEKGGAALDAVEAAIVVMEESPLFNAGKGAVFTADGRNELDASIMDGATLNAGAVAGVTHVRNPIRLARSVLDHSPHVLLAGQGAEEFARNHGIELVPATWFWTERRFRQLLKVQEKGEHALLLDHDGDHRFGTVGAVVLDAKGNLAAGTSTGGLTNKAWGRIGDSPIIGAGTYASNRSCAVSGTGQGEYFMRLTIAREICALVEYRDMALQAAADEMIHHRLKHLGGAGGVIALGKDGTIAFSFNTEGMYRGWLDSRDPDPKTAIYKD
ncbi:MAG: isoaspartyl peptidase/L-asparaginase [Alphaproteobacteria bacterium]|nr:MAG: isoaspartyl peptidase/L-asparaginase [Alphaproteobacteria bacterium]